MGITGTPWPTPKTKSINPPASGVTFWEMSHISTGNTSDTAHGAQPRAKKMPREKAPMKDEYLKRPIEKLTTLSMKPFLSAGASSESAFRKEMRDRIGSMISPTGLRLFIPSTIIRSPAARSKNLAWRMKTPRSERKNPTTKKTRAIPRVKATPIMKPSLEAEVLFFR